MREVLEYLGAVVAVRSPTARMTIDTSSVRVPGGAVRAGAAHARLHPDHGPAGGAVRPGARGHARRLQPGAAQDRHPPARAGRHGRGRRSGPRLRRGDGPSSCRRLDIFLDYPSVGATENLLMAAVMAEGTTRSRTPPGSPRSSTCASSWSAWAPTSRGRARRRVVVHGVDEMHPAEHTVHGRSHRGRNLPDRGAPSRAVTSRSTGHQPARAGHVPVQAAGGRRAAPGEHAQHPGDGATRALLRGHRHGHVALPGLPHRPAGADDGAAVAGAGVRRWSPRTCSRTGSGSSTS